MLTTTNYNFKKPELTDSPPDITATNDNWDTLDTNLKDAQDKAQDWNNFKANGGIIGTAGYVGADENGLIIGKSGVDYSKVRIITSDNYNSLAPESNTMTLGNTDKPWKTLYLKTGKILSPAGDSDLNLYIQANDGVNLILQTKSTESVTGDLVLVNTPGELGFRPTLATGGNRMDLGKSTLTFKDLWLGNSSITNNGYSKLPNGMLLQMGTATVVGGVNGMQINFPIQFESTIIKIIPSVADNNKGATPVQVWLTGKNKANFYVRTSEPNTIIDWIAIGK